VYALSLRAISQYPFAVITTIHKLRTYPGAVYASWKKAFSEFYRSNQRRWK